MKFLLLILSLSFILSINSQEEPPVVIPQWSCWFHTYQGSTRLVNLVYSYHNTGNEEQIINTGTVNNQIVPLSLDGAQNYIFKTGTQAFAFTLVDYNDTLSSSSIVWTLNGQAVSVAKEKIVTEERCDVKFSGVCPLHIGHFCDDSVYCNGLESCFSPLFIEAMTSYTNGTCSRPNIGIVCQPGFICHEESRTCIDNTPPPPPAPLIRPSFECWFYHSDDANSPMVISLVLSYNNSAQGPIVRPITTSAESIEPALRNEISPAPYNQLQPTLFYPGYNKGAFTLKDTANILTSPGGTILWRLTTEEFSFSRDDITISNQCQEDTTQSPPSSPTSAPSSNEGDEETEIPTEEPESDGRVHTKQCTEENPDCTAYDSFCDGPTQCDTGAEICVQSIHAYSPCQHVASKLTIGSPLTISCVERLKICVSSVNCTIDKECNDGLICNGKEYCMNGTCVMTVNFTCGPNQTCIEGQGCAVVNQTLSNPVIGAIIICITGGVMIVIGIFGWYFYDKKKAYQQGKGEKKF